MSVTSVAADTVILYCSRTFIQTVIKTTVYKAHLLAQKT